MSQRNVEIVKDGLERFVETHEVPWAILDQQVEVHDHDTPDQGVYRGHADYARWLGDWGGAWSKWSFAIEELVDAGEQIVAFIRVTAVGQSSGIEVERHDALVYELRERMIVRCDYYNNRVDALEQVGLRP
jgi:hypothetical protein